MREPLHRFTATVRRWALDRYLLVGLACAGVNNVILIAGDKLGLGHLALVLLAWLIGCSLGYRLHTRFTFAMMPTWAAYARFMAGCMIGIPLSWICLTLFAGVLALPMLWAAPLTTLAMILYNYASARVSILIRGQPRTAPSSEERR